MMDAWERESPGRIETIARALGDIRPSQLSDPNLFDFLSLGHRDGAALPDAQAWLESAAPKTLEKQSATAAAAKSGARRRRESGGDPMVKTRPSMLLLDAYVAFVQRSGALS